MSDDNEIIPPETFQPPATQSPAAVTGFRSSAEVDKLWGALAPALGKMEAPKRTKTATVRGTARSGREFDYTFSFSPLEEIVRVARPVLAEAKAGFWQFPIYRGDQSMLRTVVYHESGQWISLDYPIFWEVQRAGQGFASGVTYARRYGLTLALGLAAEDDDDANLAQGNEATIGPSQTDDFVRTQQASTGRGADVRQFPQGVTRANPAVAEPRPKAAEAGKRLETAIDAVTSWIEARAIWDIQAQVWGEKYKADAAEVEAASPAGLKALQERLRRKLEAFNQPQPTATSDTEHAKLIRQCRDQALLGGKDRLRTFCQQIVAQDTANGTRLWPEIYDQVMSEVVQIAERYDEGNLTEAERADAKKLEAPSAPAQTPAFDLNPPPPRGGKGKRPAA